MCKLSDDGDTALSTLRQRYHMANTHPFTLGVLDGYVPQGKALPRVTEDVAKTPLVLRYHPLCPRSSG